MLLVSKTRLSQRWPSQNRPCFSMSLHWKYAWIKQWLTHTFCLQGYFANESEPYRRHSRSSGGSGFTLESAHLFSRMLQSGDSGLPRGLYCHNNVSLYSDWLFMTSRGLAGERYTLTFLFLFITVNGWEFEFEFLWHLIAFNFVWLIW